MLKPKREQLLRPAFTLPLASCLHRLAQLITSRSFVVVSICPIDPSSRQS